MSHPSASVHNAATPVYKDAIVAEDAFVPLPRKPKPLILLQDIVIYNKAGIKSDFTGLDQLAPDAFFSVEGKVANRNIQKVVGLRGNLKPDNLSVRIIRFLRAEIELSKSEQIIHIFIYTPKVNYCCLNAHKSYTREWNFIVIGAKLWRFMTLKAKRNLMADNITIEELLVEYKNTYKGITDAMRVLSNEACFLSLCVLRERHDWIDSVLYEALSTRFRDVFVRAFQVLQDNGQIDVLGVGRTQPDINCAKNPLVLVSFRFLKDSSKVAPQTAHFIGSNSPAGRVGLNDASLSQRNSRLIFSDHPENSVSSDDSGELVPGERSPLVSANRPNSPLPSISGPRGASIKAKPPASSTKNAALSKFHKRVRASSQSLSTSKRARPEISLIESPTSSSSTVMYQAAPWVQEISSPASPYQTPPSPDRLPSPSGSDIPLSQRSLPGPDVARNRTPEANDPYDLNGAKTTSYAIWRSKQRNFNSSRSFVDQQRDPRIQRTDLALYQFLRKVRFSGTRVPMVNRLGDAGTDAAGASGPNFAQDPTVQARFSSSATALSNSARGNNDPVKTSTDPRLALVSPAATRLSPFSASQARSTKDIKPEPQVKNETWVKQEESRPIVDARRDAAMKEKEPATTSVATSTTKAPSSEISARALRAASESKRPLRTFKRAPAKRTSPASASLPSEAFEGIWGKGVDMDYFSSKPPETHSHSPRYPDEIVPNTRLIIEKLRQIEQERSNELGRQRERLTLNGDGTARVRFAQTTEVDSDGWPLMKPGLGPPPIENITLPNTVPDSRYGKAWYCFATGCDFFLMDGTTEGSIKIIRDHIKAHVDEYNESIKDDPEMEAQIMAAELQESQSSISPSPNPRVRRRRQPGLPYARRGGKKPNKRKSPSPGLSKQIGKSVDDLIEKLETGAYQWNMFMERMDHDDYYIDDENNEETDDE
ncbi:hypothetical protein V1517DRAFT_332744 [Lipomyces orientalis]|uniref:Uncharacterized protein n=1 Tax=Lipomyces orientalis TaxID=1233043 RepID=A0ACC3TE60_9ASCO